MYMNEKHIMCCHYFYKWLIIHVWFVTPWLLHGFIFMHWFFLFVLFNQSGTGCWQTHLIRTTSQGQGNWMWSHNRQEVERGILEILWGEIYKKIRNGVRSGCFFSEDSWMNTTDSRCVCVCVLFLLCCYKIPVSCGCSSSFAILWRN